MKTETVSENASVQRLPDDPGRLAALCALWQSGGSLIWITLHGGSMAPTFLPGTRLQIQCSRQNIAVGKVLVFRDANRLVAHRLIQIISNAGSERQFLCLGDGNVFPDPPVPESSILGIVVASVPSPIHKRLLYLILHPRRHARYVQHRLRQRKLLSGL